MVSGDGYEPMFAWGLVEEVGLTNVQPGQHIGVPPNTGTRGRPKTTRLFPSGPS